jgi:protein-S-isoprenylcysteine O-methyltransferase Ste14
MNLKALSTLAFALMVAGIVWLGARHQLVARSIWAAAVQLAAVGLMIWARLTFGTRSFHATANPTAGGLVTTGPYAFVRHPIYAAALYFTWAAVLDYRTPIAFAAGVLVTIGAALRMYSEESLLVTMYPDYVAYKNRTARVVPFVI